MHPRTNRHMIAPTALCVAAVEAETTPQMATQTQRYRLGRAMALSIMLEGTCILTYPTNRMEMHVWYWTSVRPRDCSRPLRTVSEEPDTLQKYENDWTLVYVGVRTLVSRSQSCCDR